MPRHGPVNDMTDEEFLAEREAEIEALPPERRDSYRAFTAAIEKSPTFLATDRATGVRDRYRVAEHANIGYGWMIFDPNGQIVSDLDLSDPDPVS